MFMNNKIRKCINCNILGSVNVVHITVNEEYKFAKQLLHNIIKSAFITIKETAVAAGPLSIDFPPEFGSRLTLSIIIRLNSAEFLKKIRKYFLRKGPADFSSAG